MLVRTRCGKFSKSNWILSDKSRTTDLFVALWICSSHCISRLQADNGGAKSMHSSLNHLL
jgi:hypothetical protein